MANETSKTPTQAKPQVIPLSKIHDLPGVFNPKPQDKSLGSMVLSIESSGIKEAVILRQRDDGEYQLLSGYRRRRASELAKKQDIPALVYEMTMQEAIAYRKAVKADPNAPIPGKPVDPSAETSRGKDGEPSTVPDEKGKDPVPGDKAKPEQTTPDKGKTAGTAPSIAGESNKGKEDKAQADPGDKGKEPVPDDKTKLEQTAPDKGKPANAAPPDTGEGDKAKEDEARAAPSDKGKGPAPGDKDLPEQTAPDKGKPANATPSDAGGGDKAKEDEARAAPYDKGKGPAPGDKVQPEQTAPDKGKPVDATPPIAGEEDKARGDKTQAAPDNKDKKPSLDSKDKPEETVPDKADKGIPSVAELEARVKAGERISINDLAAASKAESEAKRKNAQPTPTDKAKSSTPSASDKKKEPEEVLTTAIEGPSSTAITQIFEKRLDPPDEASRKTLPVPKEGESYFITLHPAYLEKSSFNNFSVDTESENFQELKKSVELVGIKDPVLARFNAEGKLEILSGQRRHVAATMLGRAVPTIIQKIDDADAKILVADGNLHRDKISYYDLSRALRMKMEGMKQKAGRRKKGYSANELQSDAKLAQEMGMSVAKLNRIIRMSEAVKGVCDLVDDGRLTISVASEMSALNPKTQDSVLHLLDLGYKATNDRISRMKKAEAGGTKLDEMMLRNILDDKDIAPKHTEPSTQPESPAVPTSSVATEIPGKSDDQPPIPASPDVPQQEGQTAEDIPPVTQAPAADQPGEAQPIPGAGQSPSGTHETPKEDDPFKGGQERPEVTKVILTGDRLRKYFPDVSMTPREIEESVYSALEERRQRQMKEQQKAAIFKNKKGGGPSR